MLSLISHNSKTEAFAFRTASISLFVASMFLNQTSVSDTSWCICATVAAACTLLFAERSCPTALALKSIWTQLCLPHFPPRPFAQGVLFGISHVTETQLYWSKFGACCHSRGWAALLMASFVSECFSINVDGRDNDRSRIQPQSHRLSPLRWYQYKSHPRSIWDRGDGGMTDRECVAKCIGFSELEWLMPAESEISSRQRRLWSPVLAFR